jgi:hypothetical protein
MATWDEFAALAPELAAFGAGRFASGVAYLATVREDGAPRVHPVTPLIGVGRLYLYMEPTSPKGKDLQRDNRYTLHCGVEDSGGGKGEFAVTGRATLLNDAALREQLDAAASYRPKSQYIVFEFSIETARSTVYQDDGVLRQKWP